MAPPLALGEVPEEVRMNKLLGMNAPPAAKVYNEKERYHVECCVEINQCVGCTRHRHAIKQALRRWRGG